MQHHGNADRGNTKDDDNFVYNDTEGEEKDKSEQEYKIHQSQLEDPHIHESKLSFPLIYLTMLIFTSISQASQSLATSLTTTEHGLNWLGYEPKFHLTNCQKRIV